MSVKQELVFQGDEGAGGPWVVVGARLEDGLNRPYELRVELATEHGDALAMELLGKSACLIVRRGEVQREVSGIVAEVTERAPGVSHAVLGAEVVLRPALEALRHRRNTRIFQEQSVPEILAAVLGEGLGAYGRSFDDRLSRSFPTCEYRVQYDETDLDFCHRLMEEEGITYFFEHEGEVERLVLADQASAHGEILTLDGSATIALSERADEGDGREHIHAFHPRSRLLSTKVSLRSFDWTHPSAPIEAESDIAAAGSLPNGAALGPIREVYEHDERPPTLHSYDGAAYGAHDASAKAQIRREALAMTARVAQGDSSVSAMRAGGIFELTGHPAPEHDGRYLVLSSTHTFGGELDYANTFRCIPADVPHRPARSTPRPSIRSMLTATVVGPSGEEIHTDSHGRIKVQFHWDRLGAMDEHSSCWMRVMQPWAGKGWGFVFLPRIGMEVVVRFVDGDPDRPVAVGALYNGDHPTPLALPGEKTKSTLRTESSPGGGGNNELRFEDAAGSEEVFLHAQKNFNEVVENDHSTTVHHDQSITVDNDQSQEVGNNQVEHIVANQDLTVDANRTVTVHGDFSETIDGSETRTVSSGVDETIDASETRTVTGGMTETISGGRTQSISGSSSETIQGSLTQTIAGAVAIDTPATYDITASDGVTIMAPAGVTIVAPAGHTLVAPGGQTIIDGEWGKSGSQWFDSIAMSFSAQLLKFNYKTLHITTDGVSFEWSTFKLAKRAIRLWSYGGVFDKIAIAHKIRAVAIEIAGAHVDAPGG